MKYHVLSEKESASIFAGEAISLTAVMAIAAIALMAVVVYRLFMSGKGSAAIPGGWKFSWD
ncbi:MAG: hypothetical protein SO176_02035 [Bacilli bacterium]|nr:hypothetical protein [Bacilli bacterium]